MRQPRLRARIGRDSALPRGLSGGAAALPDDASTLAFSGAAPDALLLAGVERVIEAWLADRTDRADRFGRLRAVVGIGRRIEELGIGPETAGGSRSSLGA